MKTLRFALACIAACVANISLRAEGLPQREKLERNGWTIGFAPADRAIAEGLAARLDYFEKRYAEAGAAKGDLGLAAFNARADEFATKVATLCALPGREEELRRVFVQLVPGLQGVQDATRRAFFMRALEIWRVSEIRQRFGAGEMLPGFVWDERANRATVNVNLSWRDNETDGRMSAEIEAPPAVPLRLQNEMDVRLAVSELVRGFDGWTDLAKSIHAGVVPNIVPLKLSKVLGEECGSAPGSRWIREGAAAWAWRELVLRSFPGTTADRYAVVIDQLPVARAGQSLLNLESWPEKNDGDHRAMACQVFCNIAEHHGADAVTQILAEFWKLPVERRTTASFRAVYHELFNEPLESRAPWRSLGVANAL